MSRRDALKTSAALVLGFYCPNRGQADPKPGELNAWISVTPGNQITLFTETPELGQGTRTANAIALAEELDVEWQAIQVEQAPSTPAVYKHLTTGGSDGTASTWLPMRQAGAQARELLLTAAAQRWGVATSECRTSNGSVLHGRTGRRLKYGDVVETASKLPVPELSKVTLKEARDFRLAGKPLPRVDTPTKVDGSAMFGMDVRVPGMLFAVIARCPYFGGKLSHFDDSDAKAIPGVKAIFAVPPIGFVSEIGRNFNVAGGVAVVAESTWAAMQARKALNISWEKGPGSTESTATLQQQLREKAAGPPSVITAERGDIAGALASAAQKIEADYEMPFQAHATMEPMNTTVHVRKDGTIEAWSPTQGGDLAQKTIASVAKVPPANVQVHVTFSGGSFGRRYQWDYLAEAYQVAKQMNVPVQLMWTREDDMQHDFYLQYSYQRLAAGSIAAAISRHGRTVLCQHRFAQFLIRRNC